MNVLRLPLLSLILFSIIAGCSRNEDADTKNETLSKSGIQVLKKTIEYQDGKMQKSDLFVVRLFIPRDKENFMRVDKVSSTLSQVVDEQEVNLLTAHQEKQSESEGRWWHVENIFSASGKHPFEAGIWTDLSLMAAPSQSTNIVNLKGNLVLLYDTGETVTDTLRNIPLKMDIEKNGIGTEIGKFKIFGTGSIVTNDTRYWSYSVMGDAEIVSVELLDYNDTKEVLESMGGRGVSATGFALHESRDLETVSLKVTTKVTRSEEVPIDLTIVVSEGSRES